MRLSILHETRYRYASPAEYSIQYLRLSPPSTQQQRVLTWSLDLPVPARPFLDGFGNVAHVLVIDRPHQEICIRATGEVEVDDSPIIIPDVGPHRPDLYTRTTQLTARDQALVRFSERFRRMKDPTAVAEALMDAIRDKVKYRAGITTVTTPAAQAFALGAGVCQDHAHVFVSCCRHLNIPARYVSGYLAPRNKRVSAMGQPQPVASHAWAEAWIDGVGWQGFDVANRVRAHGRHVRLAVGLDYLDACPIRGFHRGGKGESLGVDIQVKLAPLAGTDPGQEQ